MSKRLQTLPNLHHLHLWFDAFDYKYRDLLLQRSKLLEPLWERQLPASITVNLPAVEYKHELAFTHGEFLFALITPADEAHRINQDLARSLGYAGISVVERGDPTYFINHMSQFDRELIFTRPWSYEEWNLELRLRSEATVYLA